MYIFTDVHWGTYQVLLLGPLDDDNRFLGVGSSRLELECSTLVSGITRQGYAEATTRSLRAVFSQRHAQVCIRPSSTIVPSNFLSSGAKYYNDLSQQIPVPEEYMP